MFDKKCAKLPLTTISPDWCPRDEVQFQLEARVLFVLNQKRSRQLREISRSLHYSKPNFSTLGPLWRPSPSRVCVSFKACRRVWAARPMDTICLCSHIYSSFGEKLIGAILSCLIYLENPLSGKKSALEICQLNHTCGFSRIKIKTHFHPSKVLLSFFVHVTVKLSQNKTPSKASSLLSESSCFAGVCLASCLQPAHLASLRLSHVSNREKTNSRRHSMDD